VQPPAGWTFTATDVGNDLNDNDFTGTGVAGVANALLFRLDSAEQRTSIGAGLFDPATPAVPEPATWALWLGGLVALGAAAARRRRVDRFNFNRGETDSATTAWARLPDSHPATHHVEQAAHDALAIGPQTVVGVLVGDPGAQPTHATRGVLGQ